MEDVKIKTSNCQLCDGIIKAVVEEKMTTKMRNEFMKEVMEFNLKVNTIPLSVYQETSWCKCK